METGDLIRTLSRAAGVRGPSLLLTLAGCAAVALLYCIVAILTLRGLRPDFMQTLPWVAGKVATSLAFALAGFALAMRLARPGGVTGAWGMATVAVFLAALTAAVSAVLLSAPKDRIEAITGGDFPHCIIIIPMVAVPAAAVFFMWLRNAAPTRPMLAGASAGGLAGGISAMAYALTCPVDSVAFISIWYSLAIAICAGLGALAGRYALRW